MLSGDFTTYPLADLLQWLDLSRKSGVLEVDGVRGTTLWIKLHDRRVVATGPAPAAKGLGRLSDWQPSQTVESLAPAAAIDSLLDLFFYSNEDHFVFTTETADFDDGLDVDMSVAELLWEGLRRLDEWPRLTSAYADDRLLLRALTPAPEKPPGLAAILEAAAAGVSIANLRLALGLSRPAVLRRIEQLREEKLLKVEGLADKPDPLAALLQKAQVLMRERQFDEAALVFQTVLAADPPHETARLLLQELEREQVAALYEELSPFAIPRVVSGRSTTNLSPAQREVLGRVNGRWDVAALTLASPLREVATLKALLGLVRRNVIELRMTESPRSKPGS